MSSQSLGYREIEHTADWELQVWAPDLVTLLEQAAHGMYALLGEHLQSGPRQTRKMELEASDPESLLVAFLSELLYFSEQEGLGFDHFDITLDGYSLHAELSGAPLGAFTKEIKAVTYHNMAIRQTERGLEVNIVFDI